MAYALGTLLAKKHKILQVVSRNATTGKKLASKLKAVYEKNLKQVYSKADFYLLCIPDDAIAKVSRSLKKVEGILVHHSGSRPLKEISDKSLKGVIYPFISINKTTKLDKKEVMVFYQASTKSVQFLLAQLLQDYKFQKQVSTDNERANLHLAAVLVNNFSNHLYYLAGILVKNPKYAQLLVKLAEQALDNFKQGKAFENQSGPARRQDVKTIKNHLTELKNKRNISDIYVRISQSIKKTYNE